MRFMRWIVFAAIGLCAMAQAQELSSFSMSAGYQLAPISPKDLNDYRAGQLWNTSTASGGEFNQLAGLTINANFGFDFGKVGLEFFQGEQKLRNTNIVSTPSYVQDSFKVTTVYLIYDYPLYESEGMLFDVGGGPGFATNFEFHQNPQTPSLDEDIIWSANPTGFKLRTGISYTLFTMLTVRVGIQYETMVSEVAAKADYQNTVGGGAITSGTKLTNASGDPVKIDLSGLRYSLGLSFRY